MDNKSALSKKKLALTLFQKKALQKAIALVATAKSEKKNILKLKYNNNVFVIPNGIDIESIKIKTNWDKRKKILFLSRIHVKKGIELFLETIYSLKKKLEGYEIIIAGEGEENYIQTLKQINEDKGCNNMVKFIGGVYGETKWELFHEADFFVLPTHSENFGYVIAEALACGTPVITTKGAPWEDINIYHCGYWIDRTHNALKTALLDLTSKSPAELKNMGINGRKLIQNKYSSKIMADKLIELYNKR